MMTESEEDRNFEIDFLMSLIEDEERDRKRPVCPACGGYGKVPAKPWHKGAIQFPHLKKGFLAFQCDKCLGHQNKAVWPSTSLQNADPELLDEARNRLHEWKHSVKTSQAKGKTHV